MGILDIEKIKRYDRWVAMTSWYFRRTGHDVILHATDDAPRFSIFSLYGLLFLSANTAGII